MGIKNYTSSVPVIRSISKIEDKLVEFGATNISKTYENNKPSGIYFTIWQNNVPMNFKLPAKLDKVREYFTKKQKQKRFTAMQLEQINAQAERTAWKILSDLVEIKLAYIQIESADLFELFLPFAVSNQNGDTFYELLKSDNFKQLKAQNV